MPGARVGSPLQDIEEMLRARYARLRELLEAKTAARRSGREGRPPDDAVWASESVSDEIQTALLERASREATQIAAALDRLARGQYGICRECGGAIGVARLRVMPFAQRCADCQRQAEGRGAGLPRAAAAPLVEPRSGGAVGSARRPRPRRPLRPVRGGSR